MKVCLKWSEQQYRTNAMGTSSSYKGSKSSSWKIARELFAELEASDSTPANQDNPAVDNQDQSPAAQAAAAIAQAIINENTVKPGKHYNFSLSGILAGGGGGGGGAIRNQRQGKGNKGGGSTQGAVKRAAKGAVAIGAARAIRNGDSARLSELGLNLEELRGLKPEQQCAKIADAIFGDTNTPDDAILKRATIEHMKEVLLAEVPLSLEDSIKGFLADLIFQLGLVEHKAANSEQQIPPSQLKNKEDQIEAWLKRKVQSLTLSNLDGLNNKRLANASAKLMEQTLAMARAALK